MLQCDSEGDAKQSSDKDASGRDSSLWISGKGREWLEGSLRRFQYSCHVRAWLLLQADPGSPHGLETVIRLTIGRLQSFTTLTEDVRVMSGACKDSNGKIA